MLNKRFTIKLMYINKTSHTWQLQSQFNLKSNIQLKQCRY